MTEFAQLPIVTNTLPTTDGKFIETVCYQCIFAKWEGDEQVGCHANMLDEHIDKEYVEFETSGKSCWLLNNVACLYYRSPLWKEMQTVDFNLQTIEQFLTHARLEMTLRADAIVIVRPGDTIQDVEFTVQALEGMEVPPKMIYIANCKAIRPSELILWAQHHMNIKWHIEYFLDEVSVNNAVDDIVFNKCENMYFIVFRAGYIPNADALSIIDRALYDKHEKFLLVTPLFDDDGFIIQVDTDSYDTKNINGLFCMRIAFKNLGGNGSSGIIDKFRILCEEQKCPHLIRTMSQLLES